MVISSYLEEKILIVMFKEHLHKMIMIMWACSLKWIIMNYLYLKPYHQVALHYVDGVLSILENGILCMKSIQYNYILYRVVYRKLRTNRSAEFKVKFSDFVNENLGKKYSCTPSKLLM